MDVLGSEGTNETKKAGGKKGKADPPTTAKSQDKKGEKKVFIFHTKLVVNSLAPMGVQR